MKVRKVSLLSGLAMGMVSASSPVYASVYHQPVPHDPEIATFIGGFLLSSVGWFGMTYHGAKLSKFDHYDSLEKANRNLP